LEFSHSDDKLKGQADKRRQEMVKAMVEAEGAKKKSH
jgi:hypothetical protein